MGTLLSSCSRGDPRRSRHFKSTRPRPRPATPSTKMMPNEVSQGLLARSACLPVPACLPSSFLLPSFQLTPELRPGRNRRWRGNVEVADAITNPVRSSFSAGKVSISFVAAASLLFGFSRVSHAFSTRDTSNTHAYAAAAAQAQTTASEPEVVRDVSFTSSAL